MRSTTWTLSVRDTAEEFRVSLDGRNEQFVVRSGADDDVGDPTVLGFLDLDDVT